MLLSTKTNIAMNLNLLNSVHNFSNLFLIADCVSLRCSSRLKDPFESQYQLIINGREKVGIKKLKNPKAFIDYSQLIDAYENLEDYNPTKKRRIISL